MRHEECRIHSDSVPGQGKALSCEVHRATAVRVQHDRGKTLCEERLCGTPGRVLEGRPRVGMHIDEPRGDVKPAGVDRSRAFRGTQVTNAYDFVSGDGYICKDPRIPCAVEQPAS